jgi:hypothetical protein
MSKQTRRPIMFLCHLWQATDETPLMPMPHRDPLEGLIGGTQIGPI